jgi:hypothetical protein
MGGNVDEDHTDLGQFVSQSLVERIKGAGQLVDRLATRGVRFGGIYDLLWCCVCRVQVENLVDCR